MTDQDKSVSMERVRIIRPQRIVERSGCFVKRYAMLLEIRGGLPGIPRERHANIVLHLSAVAACPRAGRKTRPTNEKGRSGSLPTGPQLLPSEPNSTFRIQNSAFSIASV